MAQNVAAVPDPAEVPAVTVPYAAACLGIGRSEGYRRVQLGQIPAVWIGPRRMVVPTAELARLVEQAGNA